MLRKIFVFPGLHSLGYDSGFSISLTSELAAYSDLQFDISWFRDGKIQGSKRVLQAGSAISLRSFESSWGLSGAHNATDMYAVKISSPSHPDVSLPATGLEGLMVYRHLQRGWQSSILTGFVPAREAGYRFAPIIHTAHCMADAAHTETINLFVNVRDIGNPDVQSAGILTAEVYDLSGELLGKPHYPVLANATVAISHDTLAKDCNISQAALQRGINVRYSGGESQFAILTLFRNRTSGSIGLEHSLAPLYYIPELKNPAVRSLIYRQLEVAA